MSEVDLFEVGQNAAVIFDMDGTLALIDHRRHYLLPSKKNWKAFYAGIADDKPNVPVINTMHGLISVGYVGLICSGRPEEYRETTEDWLRRHFVNYRHLYMRPTGDYRSDVDIKLETLAAIRESGYVPVLACDDRDRLVQMWREQGLVCLQAAPGDF